MVSTTGRAGQVVQQLMQNQSIDTEGCMEQYEEESWEREDKDEEDNELAQNGEDEDTPSKVKEPARDKGKVWPDASKDWLEQVGWEYAREMRGNFMAQVELQLKNAESPES